MLIMPNYSQCPGECYDSFWEEEINQPTLNIDELFDKHYKQASKVRINYHYQNDLELRWKYRETMAEAIKTASVMSESGDYNILSIITEYTSLGQD